jgi:hypothetical protein
MEIIRRRRADETVRFARAPVMSTFNYDARNAMERYFLEEYSTNDAGLLFFAR